MNTIDVIKQQKKRPTEKFNVEKLEASINAACLSAKIPSGSAEHIARAVSESVAIWAGSRDVITSDDIRRIATLHLQKHHPDVAYAYEQYKHVI